MFAGFWKDVLAFSTTIGGAYFASLTHNNEVEVGLVNVIDGRADVDEKKILTIKKENFEKAFESNGKFFVVTKNKNGLLSIQAFNASGAVGSKIDLPGARDIVSGRDVNGSLYIFASDGRDTNLFKITEGHVSQVSDKGLIMSLIDFVAAGDKFYAAMHFLTSYDVAAVDVAAAIHRRRRMPSRRDVTPATLHANSARRQC
jgi:hypothetical protein